MSIIILSTILSIAPIWSIDRYEAYADVTEPVTQIETEEVVETEVIVEESPKFMVECTAYYNPNNNLCADGTVPISGHTLAGKREWVGKKCKLYDEELKLIGEYRFHDTGFGNDIDGDGVGSIQEGKCIDIFMDTRNECIEWGRKNVWIEWIGG